MTLNTQKSLLLGLFIFSMFFGAGNLIFPPQLGVMSAEHSWVALAGFTMTAVIFVMLALITVIKTNGLENLAGRVHPVFATIFVILIYLSIGPCLAIPRTASTSFEMLATPFLAGDTSTLFGMSKATVLQALYSLGFFAIAFSIARKPSQLSRILGRFLTPTLLTLIFILFMAVFVGPYDVPGVANATYAASPFTKGFLDGYQTMDAIAALNFGLLVVLNLKGMGVTEEKDMVRETIRGGIIAGVCMFAIYAMLTYIGMQAGGTFTGLENGANTLTQVAQNKFGTGGLILLGAIFFIACLNTCTSLLSACSSYFSGLLPKMSYMQWLVLFTVSSMIVSNAGLTNILKFSIPVLVAIYPIALVLIVLGLFQRFFTHHRYVYVVSILFTGVLSIMSGLKVAGIPMPVLEYLPLYRQDLFWVIPAIVGAAIGYVMPKQTVKA